METPGQITRIEDKLQRLLKEYHAAQKEAQRLKKENARLMHDLQTKTEHAKQLQQKVDALKLTTAGLQDGGKKDLEQRIDIYLKDIDRCLALLNS